MEDNYISQKLLFGLLGFLVVSAAYLLFRIYSLENNIVLIPQAAGGVSLLPVLIAGLFVGGLTCLAVQGGLLASTIAARGEQDLEEGSKRRHNLWPVVAFLTTKFFTYSVLGFLLGAFGQALALSDTVQIIMQFLAGAYMLAIALNLLDVHPILRYVVIQPPRFLTRMVKNQSKSKDIFAPALLGGLTIFIPCGTTLAMEALAISASNPLLGAAIMGTFTLGTMPLFFGIGFLTTTFSDAFRSKFFKLAAVLVLYLGLTSINGALLAAGSPVTFQSLIDPIQSSLSSKQNGKTNSDIVIRDGVQTVDITVYPNAYTPNYFQVEAGKPVKLNLTTTNQVGCTSAFRIPSLGISKRLAPGSTDYVAFTPEKPGKITFTCGMGMYSGLIDVKGAS